MEESSEHREYRRLIERLAKAKSPQRVPNGLPGHAAILFEAFFKHADHAVRIYSGKLCDETFRNPRLIRSAKAFLNRRGTKLWILLQQKLSVEELKSRELIRVLNDRTAESDGGLAVAFATGVYATNRAKHFAVMDESGYRFELDHDKTQAFASFYEPEAAEGLAATFDRVMSDAETVKL